MKQITSTFVSGHITEFPELQEAHRKVKAEYESLHQRMKSLDRRQIDTLPEGEYTVERKWDGIFCGLIWNNEQGAWTAVTPGGNIYDCDEWLSSVEEPIFEADAVRQCTIIGELYSVPTAGSLLLLVRRERVHSILSSLASGDVQSVRFHEFRRFSPPITKPKLLTIFDQYLATGAEGIVIRQVNGSGIWKLKPKMNLDCVVIGYTEETLGEVKSLLCGLIRPDGCIQPLGAIGSNISERDRRYIWTILQESKIETNRPIVHDGQSVQVVLPVHYIEISCNDIVTEKSDGSPIMKPCYNLSINIVSTAPFCTLRGAYFERMRQDKTINGVTTSQVTDYVHIDKIDANCKDLYSAQSQVIEELRFVKGDAVKRLLTIHKGEGNNPEYAIHLTDYSPNRKVAIEYEVMVTNDEDEAADLFSVKAQEIESIRGWSRA